MVSAHRTEAFALRQSSGRLIRRGAGLADARKSANGEVRQVTEHLDRDDVAVVERHANVPPEAVWAVLADGWLYSTWVVGATRIREVDAAWPAVDSRIHHSFGLWPAVIDDTTHVLESEADRLLVLAARGWPVGEAEVRIRLTPAGDDGTTLTIEEALTGGLGRLLPTRLEQLAVRPRNGEALRRLCMLAEGRYRHDADGAGDLNPD